jgi:hypothetical protein
MEPELPIELLIHGYPISHQTKRKSVLDDWKKSIHDQARAQMEAGHFLLQGLLTAAVYYFPQSELEPDLDNATKPVLDGLCQCIYVDDKQIERLVIQRFEPGRAIPLLEDTPRFTEAVASSEPIIYIRLEAFDGDVI